MPRGNWSREFDRPAAAIIKHTNPCGCAEQESLAEAYRKALECDPVSAFGGVIGFNRDVDRGDRARNRQDIYRSDCRAGFTRRRRSTVLQAKKNLRLLEGHSRR